MQKYEFFLMRTCSIALCCLSCNQREAVSSSNFRTIGSYHEVMSRRNALDSVWTSYIAKTVDRLPGFEPSQEPQLSVYGGWMNQKFEATGFFRTQKVNDRWWIIDPEGYSYIHKAVVAFRPGLSENMKRSFDDLFEDNQHWAQSQTRLLRKYGFNGAGAWSAVDILREMEQPPVYTLIVSPMASYRREHIQQFGGRYEQAGWQGYRYDLVMVFDPEFDEHIENTLKPIVKYKEDKFLLGYFTDNELPWVNDALDRHLKFLGEDEHGHIAARKWLNERKGFEAGLDDITHEDRIAFSGFYFETYVRKVTEVLRKYDPNHMYLGCRFNQEREQELTNPEIFRVAGKYMDIISINHYRKWEPDQEMLSNWGEWSGKPFLITEWYTKGEDSGLPNHTGAGWNVPTQLDRGYFYQNFTIELLNSKYCVGWHWFKYMDNDPENIHADPSNRDSNKGIVTIEYKPYLPLLEQMKEVNDNVHSLIKYFDNQRN